MQLQLRTFNSLVAAAAAAVQAAATTVLDLTVGSVLRAVLEANAGLGLWLQWLILEVLQVTRAATSSGPDLDSWMADFQLTRLGAAAAQGSVTFARFSPATGALVPAGTTVRTTDGAQSFAVGSDPTNPAWSAAQNGYLLAIGTASVTVPVTATVAGSGGNVQAGAITLITAAVPGVDTVSNAAPTGGGLDAESDAALRARFAAYLVSLFKATTPAVAYAISTVQQGLHYTIQENVMPNGAAQPGFFVVTVDDGSGAPSPTLLSAVAVAIEAVRPVGVEFGVLAPVVATANITMTLTTPVGVSHSAAVAQVVASVSAYVNALPVGAGLAYSRLAQVAYDAAPTVTNITSVSINNAGADIVPGPGGVVKLGTLVVI